MTVMWARRCGHSASYGAHASADGRTDTSTMPTAGDGADDCSGAGADQTAADRTLSGDYTGPRTPWLRLPSTPTTVDCFSLAQLAMP